jgi:LysM repeat protein
MNKVISIIVSLAFVCFAFNGLSQKQTPQQYIAKWKSEAISQMAKHSIPASITLAQGILESGSGNSDLAKLANNHFGIKCHSTWTGETFIKDDDEKDECFRKYNDASESYTDHSLFLKKNRYKPLFELDLYDYKGWAKGLKKAGYATNPKYPNLLISLIERYNLTKYDTQSIIAVEEVKKDEIEPILIGEPVQEEISMSIYHTINKTANLVPYIIIKDGDTYEKLEKEFGIRKRQIVKYNDLSKTHELVKGERIFLKPKRCKSKEELHFVKQGETMRDISQKYGVKLSRLYKRNHLDEGSQPKAGQKIYLRKNKKD